MVLAADDDTALREQALATLVLLTEDNASNAEFCRRTDVGLRRTLEVAQAIVYALALAPWAVTRNFVAFVRGNQGSGGADLSALALQDANGVGDPSGSGA